MQALSDIFFRGESAFIPTKVVVDAGSLPLPYVTLQVSDASATADKSVVCSIGLNSNVPFDEFECEPLLVSGYVSQTGTLTFTITTAVTGGMFSGPRTINYYLG